MALDCQIPKFQKVRAYLTLAVYPIQFVVDMPIGVASTLVDQFQSRQRMIKTNAELRTQLVLQQGRLQKLHALEAENKRLRALLNSTSNTQESHWAATILSVDNDPFAHLVMINKGIQDGVFEGQPVIDADGVMGAVIRANAKTSQVMLITDASHGIPVENTRNGIRAIAVGTGNIRQLELQHVPHTVDIAKGDLFVTSGLGGRFPEGYPVGTVENIEKDLGRPFATIHLNPSAHIERSRQVLLVQPFKEHRS